MEMRALMRILLFLSAPERIRGHHAGGSVSSSRLLTMAGKLATWRGRASPSAIQEVDLVNLTELTRSTTV